MSQQANAGAPNQGPSDKFNHFNNAPSKFYDINYSYYPVHDKQIASTDQSKFNERVDPVPAAPSPADSPYKTFKNLGLKHNKTQLQIEVALKPEYQQTHRLLLRLVAYASQVLLISLVIGLVHKCSQFDSSLEVLQSLTDNLLKQLSFNSQSELADISKVKEFIY
mmetsp:Transcript_16540/g.28114  ORF Transcript_16540/g.28114 Transcript_16540/m.28114 type:complete len:165 (+) Transcript_16540:88-582(+)